VTENVDWFRRGVNRYRRSDPHALLGADEIGLASRPTK
jgi:hypothetical protein